MESTVTPLHALFERWGAEFLCEYGLQRPLRVRGAGPEYEAARTGVALADGGDRAWLQIDGADAEEFLQRVLSSDLRALAPGAGQWSAMLDGKGHWVSDLLLYRLPGALPSFGMDLPAVRAAAMTARLELLHFSEELAWTVSDAARLLVLGPQGAAQLAAAGVALPPELAATDGFRCATVTRAATPDALLVLRRPDRGAECLELIGAAGSLVTLAEELQAAGAVPCGLVALDILRVEAFQARWGDDFDEQDTLPNCNEWRRASLSKGCYAGQEVVAKINTYGEAPRQLCRLRFDGGPQPLRGAELFDADGKAVGAVRSWVWSPQAEQGVGLGMLRRRAAVDGASLVAHLGELRVTARVEVPGKELGG